MDKQHGSLFEFQASSTSPSLPKVHSATKGSSGISYIQSIFQPVPILYKYSADQLQVVVERRNGEVERISKDSGCGGVSNGRQRGKQKQRLKKNGELLNQTSITNNELETSVDLKQVTVENNFEPKSTQVRVAATNDEGSCDLEQISSVKETSRPPSNSSKTSTPDECPTCGALISILNDADAQTLKLREELDSQSLKLSECVGRLEELLKENKKLKQAVLRAKNGMSGLTKIIKCSNADSDLNDKRIFELLQRARLEGPREKTEISLKSIDSNIEKMRDHVSRLTIVPPYSLKSLTPSSIFSLQNNTEAQALSFTVNIIKDKNNTFT